MAADTGPGHSVGAQAGERIAILLHAAQGGGAERAMITVANQLAETGRTVDLVLTRKQGPLLSEISGDVRLVDLGAGQVRKAFGALNRYVREARPDVMMSALPSTDMLALLGKAVFRWPLRLVISVQNNPTAESVGETRFLERRWPFFIRRLYPSADQVIAISEGVAEEVSKIWGERRGAIPVINNPLDLERVDRMRAEAPEHPWLADQTIPTALAVGRLVPQKDYPTMLKAFAKVRATRQIRLAIAGQGPDQAVLEALCRELGIENDVAFMGFVSNPFAAMATASVFVLSSRWEGFANVVAEAVCCGASIVSTDCPAGPAEILEDGKWGVLTPVGDVDALAAGLERAFDADVDKAALRQRAEAFAKQTIAERYFDFLRPRKAAA
ncbi:MAG: glycosyltransferase [Pseudomonadota bacterium]